jgi:REP element-mobilizing transposase RayT
MPRPLRPDVRDSWHHVMNRGVDRADVFFDDNDRVQFGRRLAEIHDRFGVETHAYCLMDNHYHLLQHCPDGGLSDAMQHLGSIYTRHVNDRLGRDGPLFRGRFHSRLVSTDAHLLATVRYIHRNVLDLPGVRSVDGYRWSSHRTYLGHRACPPWMRLDTVMSMFGGDRAAFDRFVRDETSTPARPEVTVADVRRLVDAVSLVLAQHGVGEQARLGVRARSAALAWSVAHSGLDTVTLMTVFGIETAGAWRSAVSRARRLAVADEQLRTATERSVALVFARPYVSTGV